MPGHNFLFILCFSRFRLNVLWVPAFGSWTVCILGIRHLYQTTNVGM